MKSKAKDILQKSTLLSLSFLLLSIYSCKPSETFSTGPDVFLDQNKELDQVDEEGKLVSVNNELLQEKEEELLNYKGSSTRYFDLLYTDLELDFDFQKQTVLGKAVLTLKPYFRAQNELILDAQDFEFEEIFFEFKEDSFSVPFSYDGQQIKITLPQTLTREDTFAISLAYTAFPERNSGGGSQAITDTKGLYFIDPLDEDPTKPTMIWTQGETNHNSKWFPTIDHPNEKMTQLFKLTVPDQMISIGNGELKETVDLGNGFHMDYWEMDKPHSPYLAAFAIGDFGEVKAEWEGIPLGYFVEKGYEKGAAKVFKNTPEMLDYFSKLLGVKYPWPKYDQVIVRDFVSGAMENTTVSIFMDDLRLNENEAIDSEWDFVIAHELFHHWFGDYVTTESWSNLTLNEGFANYSEYLWNEHKYGKDQASLKLVAEMETYFQESKSKQVDLIRHQYEDSEDMFDSHSYSKGGVILHMLRKYLGDEVFFEALNFYLRKHAFSNVEVHDLRMAFEEISGEDLNWFFNQWFLAKGHPELLVEINDSIPENVVVSITQTQDLKDNPLYKLPFEVSWYVNGERKIKKFMLEKGSQQFALENGDPTSLVIFDEEKDLLVKKNQTIPKDQWVSQFTSSEFGIARYEALDSLMSLDASDELKLILPEALKDDFWSIRELALSILQSHKEWMEDNPDLEELVLSIVENDEKNSVKAGGIDVLAALQSKKYKDRFLELVDQPSVLISSSALTALIDLDGEDLSEEFLEKFAEENNFRYVIPVSEYYITKPIKGKASWFNDKIETLSGEGLYFFLGYYGEYFSRLPEEEKDIAVENLKKIMKSDPMSFVRLGAFQAILAFSDDPEVVKSISEISQEEKDPDLRNYYEYFIEALKEEN